MKHIVFIFLICFGLVASLSAKLNWTQGYVVQSNSDTVRGYIQERDSKSNAFKCYFRTSLSSPVTEYSPTQLKAFQYNNGRYYVSRKLKTKNGSNVYFLEYLIHGKLNIYHIEGDSSIYYAEKDTMFYPLNNSSSVQLIDHIEYKVEKFEYIGLFKNLMSDAQLTSEIEGTKLRPKSLIKLARDYHTQTCSTESCIIYERKRRSVKLNLALSGGLSVNSFQFEGRVGADTKILPAAAIRLEFENLFEWNEKLSLVLDCGILHWGKNTLQALNNTQNNLIYNNKPYVLTYYNYEDFISEEHNITKIQVDMDATFLRIPLVIHYNFSNTGFRPYLGAGFIYNLCINQNKEFKLENTYTTYGHSIPPNQFGATAHAGAKWMLNAKNYLFAECSFDFARNITRNQAERCNQKNFNIVCGWGF